MAPIMLRQSGDHSCESAIYFDMDVDLVKQLCDFRVFHSLEVKPKILENNKTILLANVPAKWQYKCAQDKHMPREVVRARYVQLAKSYLCFCTITMQDFQLS